VGVGDGSGDALPPLSLACLSATHLLAQARVLGAAGAVGAPDLEHVGVPARSEASASEELALRAWAIATECVCGSAERMCGSAERMCGSAERMCGSAERVCGREHLRLRRPQGGFGGSPPDSPVACPLLPPRFARAHYACFARPSCAADGIFNRPRHSFALASLARTTSSSGGTAGCPRTCERAKRESARRARGLAAAARTHLYVVARLPITDA
jgi:hypothetical protein